MLKPSADVSRARKGYAVRVAVDAGVGGVHVGGAVGTAWRSGCREMYCWFGSSVLAGEIDQRAGDPVAAVVGEVEPDGSQHALVVGSTYGRSLIGR